MRYIDTAAIYGNGRSPAQVLIRWSPWRGFVVLPKSSNPKRIAENAAVFDFSLSEPQMARPDALEDGFRPAWDPSEVPQLGRSPEPFDPLAQRRRTR